MNCPKCNIPMERGNISSDSYYWYSEKDVLGALKKLGAQLLPTGPKLIAYRCPQCYKVELETEGRGPLKEQSPQE